jgi:hypothetical protein
MFTVALDHFISAVFELRTFTYHVWNNDL